MAKAVKVIFTQDFEAAKKCKYYAYEIGIPPRTAPMWYLASDSEKNLKAAVKMYGWRRVNILRPDITWGFGKDGYVYIPQKRKRII